MRKCLLALGSAAALAACGRSADQPAEQAAANSAQPKKKKPPYCFFKEPETKDWTAARDKDGNVVVKGKAFRSDPRYRAVLGAPVVSGTSAELSPSITINDTGYAAPENWWDLSATIPASQSIDTVKVTCGSRTLASIAVPPQS